MTSSKPPFALTSVAASRSVDHPIRRHRGQPGCSRAWSPIRPSPWPGHDHQNRANLAGAFLQQIIKKYEGTRLGRQELNAELLDDVPGALWSRALIEAARPPMGFVMPDLVRVVVAIDPAVGSARTPTRPASSSPARTRTAAAMYWPTSPATTRRSSGPASPSPPIRATAPTGSSPRSTTAARWSRRRCAWSTTTSPIPQCTPPAARWCGPSRSPRSTSRAASGTWAPSPRSKIRCASSRRTSTGQRPKRDLDRPFKPGQGRPHLARPRRCAGVGLHRAPRRSDLELGHLRDHPAQGRGGGERPRGRRGRGTSFLLKSFSFHGGHSNPQ